MLRSAPFVILAGPPASTLVSSRRGWSRPSLNGGNFRLMDPPLNQPLGSRECPRSGLAEAVTMEGA